MFASVVPQKPVTFQVTLKEAEGVSPFKPIENKEPLSETKIKQKLEMAEERRLVSHLFIVISINFVHGSSSNAFSEKYTS